MTTTEHSKVPPVVCAAWCENQDGHPNEWFVEDQKCWAPATYVDLELEPVHREEGGEYPHRLGVMVRGTAGESVVYVHLQDIVIHPWGGRYNLDDSLSLTADEAVRLAEALIANARLVRNQTG
jgi:hypothetical protein